MESPKGGGFKISYYSYVLDICMYYMHIIFKSFIYISFSPYLSKEFVLIIKFFEKFSKKHL